MNLVAFRKQKGGEIGAVLPGDPRDERRFSHKLASSCFENSESTRVSLLLSNI